jgi:hypothetical protein
MAAPSLFPPEGCLCILKCCLYHVICLALYACVILVGFDALTAVVMAAAIFRVRSHVARVRTDALRTVGSHTGHYTALYATRWQHSLVPHVL